MENNPPLKSGHQLDQQDNFVKFDVSAFNEKETIEARKLFSEVFGHCVSAEHWNWKYVQGPRLGSVNMVARTSAGELIGHAGSILFSGIYKNQPLIFAQVCDVMVSRHVRGGLDHCGVYPRLMKALQETLHARFGTVFAYGFPGVRPFRLGERMGFYRQLYPVKSSRFTGFQKQGFAFQTGVAVEIEWNIERLDLIWKRIAGCQKSPMLERTGNYMLWRYHAHPERSYRLWIIKSWCKDAGWLVTATMPNGEIVIIDALLPPKITANLACRMLWCAFNKAHEPVSVIVHWLDQSDPSACPNGIIACEILVDDWHTLFLPSGFQPGDTDVF